ncbi:MAG TPA: hypothetical protein VKD22_04960 [Ramlibacter sp.]|nr:hypothetical protein [Ramlibacter sp.]
MTSTCATPLSLRVAQALSLDPLIRVIRPCAAGAGALPGHAAGAHVRDYVLSERGKREGNVIQVCISRCKGQRLVPDL